MLRRIQPLSAASRAALAATAVGAVIALAGCGSAVAGGRSVSAGGQGAASVPGGKASAGVALCRDIPRLTSVTASWTTALHELEPGLVLPNGITIRKPLLVRDLATALCGLPKMPRGSVSCLAKFTRSLRLVFAAGGRPFRPDTVQMNGCRVVSGLGPARAVPSSGFWRTLGKDLGLKFPQNTSQSGTSNPGS